MRRLARLAVLLSALVTLQAHAGPAAGQGRYLWVNTTEDLVSEPSQCIPRQPCTLRKAIELAEGAQSVVTACFDPELVPGARPCPSGALPLTADDENYDPETGRWTMTIRKGAVPFVLSRGGTRIDFSFGIETYVGAQDNRIVIDPDVGRDPADDPRTDLFLIEGTDNALSGFELRGSYQVAAIIARKAAANNRFGPGLVLAGMPQGIGIQFENRDTVGNRIAGLWCGVTGDGTVVDALRDDCLRFSSGASANTVGGELPDERNVLVAAELGVGVSIEGRTTRDNTVQGNFIGVLADGATPAGNEAGIRVVDGASGTRIVGNVIAGNRNNGIAVFGECAGTVVEDNRIGVAGNEATCVSNGGVGVSMQGAVAGGRIARNVIHCNQDGGIVIRDPLVQRVTISENSVSRNHGTAVLVADGANGGVQPPVVQPQSATEVRGRTCPGCKVELFTDPAGEADVFEGVVLGDAADGTFVFAKTDFAYRSLRATATEGENTSALSDAVLLDRPPRPTNTPFGQRTPTPSPTLPTAVFHLSFLPYARVGP
jgi:parallel beta-helix repeat protein